MYSKYKGNYVFTIAGVYYQDIDHVKPSDLQQLDPNQQPEYGTPVTSVGEVPNYENPPRYAMLTKAGIVENVHITQEELAEATPTKTNDGRFGCFLFNCPVPWCSPVKYSIKKLEELGFLNPTLTVWLGESIHSSRHKEYDALMFLQDTLQTTSMMTQSAAMLSNMSALHSNPMLGHNKEYLERMAADYERLIKMLYNDKAEDKE